MDGVKITLQFKERNSKGPWKVVLTTQSINQKTSYNPSTNDSFSDKKDYEFRLFAENCVGSVVSEICSVKGKFKLIGVGRGVAWGEYIGTVEKK